MKSAKTKALRLSQPQINVLLLGVDHKLDRWSAGWAYDDRVNSSEPVRIYVPATIKALWKRGLLVGNFNDPCGVGNQADRAALRKTDGAIDDDSVGIPKRLRVWTSDLGRAVLKEMDLLPDGAQSLH